MKRRVAAVMASVLVGQACGSKPRAGAAPVQWRHGQVMLSLAGAALSPEAAPCIEAAIVPLLADIDGGRLELQKVRVFASHPLVTQVGGGASLTIRRLEPPEDFEYLLAADPGRSRYVIKHHLVSDAYAAMLMKDASRFPDLTPCLKMR